MTGLLDWCRENKDDTSSEASLYPWNILEEAPKKPIILGMKTSLFYFFIKRDKGSVTLSIATGTVSSATSQVRIPACSRYFYYYCLPCTVAVYSFSLFLLVLHTSRWTIDTGIDRNQRKSNCLKELEENKEGITTTRHMSLRLG